MKSMYHKIGRNSIIILTKRSSCFRYDIDLEDVFSGVLFKAYFLKKRKY